MAIEFPFRFDQRYQPGSIPQFGSFGPPNISNMLQSSISKLADPFISRLRELEVTNRAAALNRDTSKIFNTPSAPAPPGATTSAPATGVLGTPAAPFVNPAAASGAGGGSFALGRGMDPSSAEPTEGGVGTVRPSSMLEAGKIGIAGVETGGSRDPYSATGPDVRRKDGSIDNAIGKYQVMASNVPSWTEKHLGQRMTPEEFRASPAAQERVFEGEFGSYLDQYGNLRDAGSKWFTGQPLKQAMARGATDTYTKVPDYITKMEGHIKRAYASGSAPEPQAAPTASFAPTVAPAPTPAAAAAVGVPVGAQAPIHTDAATGRPIAAGDPRINPDIQGRPVMPGGRQQIASLDPTTGAGSIRPPTPEIAPRRVPTQAVGSDGQPLPPQQQPAAPLPTGQPPNPQPAPPPPPPVEQPPPPPPPPVQPPPPVMQAALPTPTVSPSSAPPLRVAPAAAAVPPQQVAAGVPTPQAPARIPPAAAPSQAAPPQQAPIDQTADRFWATVAQHARTPEEVAFANAKRLELRQPKVTYTVVDGVLVKHDERGNAVPVYGDKNKGAPTVEVGESKGRMQWNPKTGLYDIPVGTPQPGALTKQQFEQEDTLRTKFAADPETKKYFTANNTYQLLRSSADSGTGVGDVSMIYQYMKMLDPDTGIKEGEVALAQQTGSLPDRIVTMYNKLVTGERFSDKQRADFVNEAGRLLQVRHSNVNRAADKYRNIAKDFQLSPDRVVQIDPYEYKPWNAPTDPRTGQPRNDPGGREADRAAQAHGSAKNPVDLSQSTPEAARRTLRTLPDDAWWVGADGVPRQKGRTP